MSDSNDYKIVRFHETGGPEVLRVERASMGELKDAVVQLKVLGIGLTQGDAMYRSGTYLEKPDLPSGLGTEICGRVEAVGDGVTKFKVGDRVSSLSSFSINQYPIYGEYAQLPEFSLVPTPENFTDLEGAGYSLAYIPMYFALMKEAMLQSGEWLVLNAGSATTSLAALQIAKLIGAKVIGITRSNQKALRLQSFGFDDVLVWSDAVAQEVIEITGGGAHVVLDPVMGSGCVKISEMCGWRGRIIHYGALDGPIASHSIYQLAPKFLTVSGFTIYGYSGSQVMDLPRNGCAMEEAISFINCGATSGALQPLIAETFVFDDVVAGHQAMQSGEHIGKLLLTF